MSNRKGRITASVKKVESGASTGEGSGRVLGKGRIRARYWRTRNKLKEVNRLREKG